MKNNKIILGILIFLIILPLTNAVSYPYTETIDTKSYIYSSNINYLSGSLILTKDNTNLSIKNISTKYDVNATIAYVLNSSKNFWFCKIILSAYSLYFVIVGFCTLWFRTKGKDWLHTRLRFEVHERPHFLYQQ